MVLDDSEKPKTRGRKKKSVIEAEKKKKKIPIHNFKDICFDTECMTKAIDACHKKLKCGHPCLGIKGEKECQPCLYEECAKKENLD